jgi:metal-dependent HD superfamily phosphatase/phosphodiesterase
LSDKRILARIDTRSSRLISLTVDAGAIGDAGMLATGRAFLSFEPDCIDIASLNPTAIASCGQRHRQAYSAVSIRSPGAIDNRT